MERPVKIELVIFDCDGVLVDTEPAARVVLVTALESLSVSAAGELADACVGKSLKGCPGIPRNSRASHQR